MSLRLINPDSLSPPIGFSHGVAGRGEILFVAGQVGWDESARIVSDAFAGQFAQALDNVLAVVRAAGGSPDSIARMTVYVTDKREYVDARRAVGEAYRMRMGKHYPAMALVEVAALLEDGAKVEIEATAILPDSPPSIVADAVSFR